LWKTTIVKSPEMKKFIPKSFLIPNGVDFSNFKCFSKDEAIKKTEFNPSTKNVIFVSQDPNSFVKNLPLAKQSIDLLNDNKIKLHLISGKTFLELPYFYNAADLLLLTSLSEGSSNVIKEAMACNLPIVSTDVGDVKKIMGNTEGCYLCSYEPEDVADKIKQALNFGKRTNGCEKIQHLDSRVVAEKIIEIYKSI
jgi:glycosyltransferase involved in cell wall biosynthesis